MSFKSLRKSIDTSTSTDNGNVGGMLYVKRNNLGIKKYYLDASYLKEATTTEIENAVCFIKFK